MPYARQSFAPVFLQKPISIAMDVKPATSLCEKCLALNLEKRLGEADCHFEALKRSNKNKRVSARSVFHGNDYFLVQSDSYPICSFDTRLSLSSTCPLCSFFSALRVRPSLGPKHKLLAFCGSSIYFLNGKMMRKRGVWKEVKSEVFLAVVPDLDWIAPDEYDVSWLFDDIREVGSIHRLPLSERGNEPGAILRPQRVKKSFDVSLVSNWLSYCEEQHGVRCSGQRNQANDLSSFRVINCHTSPPSLEIRPFTDKYVALSYVWGVGPPEAWPCVVKDAVQVTTSLGLQYLWVDRLCIDQNNPHEKRRLISKMARIYECAEFTIVAAAGSDATYGLPGSSTKPRSTQPEVQIGLGAHLISAMSDPRALIQKSVWSTRGWTYQEGVLSSRRLVFTDDQVYFECRGMAVWESIGLPLRLYHDGTGQKMDSYIRSGIFRGSMEPVYSSLSSFWGFGEELGNPDPLYQSVLRLDDHVHSFSQKSLSYDSDSLLAFQGIIDHFASDNGLRMLVGIPVSDYGYGVAGNSCAWLSFALGISFWAHTEAGSTDNEFCHAWRRRHLPSWTWAGWKGTITWAAGGNVHSELFSPVINWRRMASGQKGFMYAPEMDLCDTSTGDIHSLSKLLTLESVDNNRPHQLLIRKPLILDFKQLEFDSNRQAWLRRDFGITLKLSIFMTMFDVVKRHETGELKSILVFFTTGAVADGTFIQFIVLQKVLPEVHVGVEVWERIGRLDLPSTVRDFEGCTKMEEAISTLPVEPFGGVIVVK